MRSIINIVIKFLHIFAFLKIRVNKWFWLYQRINHCDESSAPKNQKKKVPQKSSLLISVLMRLKRAREWRAKLLEASYKQYPVNKLASKAGTRRPRRQGRKPRKGESYLEYTVRRVGYRPNQNRSSQNRDLQTSTPR